MLAILAAGGAIQATFFFGELGDSDRLGPDLSCSCLARSYFFDMV